ncbi:hypothetical protein EYR36_005289 [Pleurotus pulmonarius]|nr:hypothetical protein EYR36_005289 [Pleurotus pulmonarius]
MERKDSIESTEKIVILEGPLTTNEHSDAEFESVVWRKVDICVVGWGSHRILPLIMDRTNLGNARIAGLQTDLRLTNNQHFPDDDTHPVPMFWITGQPADEDCWAEHPPAYVADPLGYSNNTTRWDDPGHHSVHVSILSARKAPTTVGIAMRGFVQSQPTDSLIGFDLPSLSIVYSAASLAGAFSGLLAAAILHMDGIGGKPGWAWIFILEGLFTVFFGLLSFFVIPRSAKHCTLLNARERDFTPSIVQGLGWSGTRAQLMTVPPYAIGFVVTNVGSYIADHYKLRGAVTIVCSICLTAGFAMFLASHSTSVQYGSLFLAIPGANAVSPAITSWVANNTAPHVRRASAIAFACVLTNIGGILATWLFGSLSPPPRYTSATVVLLVASVGLGIAAAGNVVYLWDQNRRKDRLRAMISKDEEPEGLGDRSAWFTYIL